MNRWISAMIVAGLACSPAAAQLSVSFQQGVNGYTGTVDNEFRAANPVDASGTKDFVSVDEFDGGFQTQGALRFENIFGNQPGQVPSGVTIGFATLTVRVTSSSDIDAILSFARNLAAAGGVRGVIILAAAIPEPGTCIMATFFAVGMAVAATRRPRK